MKLTIDTETRSACDLKSHGAWVYAEHPSTQIMCLAVKVDSSQTKIWLNPAIYKTSLPLLPTISLTEIFELMDLADEIEAHNSMFEQAIFEHVAVKRMGWRALPLHKLRCTMSVAAYRGLPLDLERACEAVSVKGKDLEGSKVMKKLSKPRKINPDGSIIWWEDPDLLHVLARYCIQDVDAEYGLSCAIGKLTEQELRIWQLDQRINARGIYTDGAACASIIRMLGQDAEAQLKKFRAITGLNSPKQIDQFGSWIRRHGVLHLSLSKADVAETLNFPDLPDPVRRALEIRQHLGLSSVSKFQAILDRVSADGRLRGMFQYHGAGTGRWAGRGVQLQNLPRKKYHQVDVDAALAGDIDWFYMTEDSLPASMSKLVRGMFMATPGNELVVADFSSIEARVTGWVANEPVILDAFLHNLDLYKVAASKIFGVPYDQISKDQRQVGKVAVLALGFGGGNGAFQGMAANYGVSLPEEQVTGIVAAWREGHPRVRKAWYEGEAAATAAIERGRPFAAGPIKYAVKSRYLLCKLPSGRCIHYPFAKIEGRITKWGTDKRSITYMKMDKGQWARRHVWYGTLFENVVQGIARDCLAEAMLRVEAAGLPLVLHVHDEGASDVPKGTIDIREYEAIMAQPPEWAEDCPMAAEGWIGERYKK